jgi:SAM-dependent methyltransferase
VYPDWEASIARQGDALAALMAQEWGVECRRVLDVAVGIGTQALGLATRGYSLVGADISPVAVRRAVAEARRRAISIPCLVSDMRAIPVRDRTVDAVIACDNALTHLLSEDEIRAALSEFVRCLREGGGCVVSLRDYGRRPERGTVETRDYGDRLWRGRPCRLRQIWSWREDTYDLVIEVVAADASEEILATTPHTTYFAVSLERIAGLMRDAGLRNVRRDDAVLFQPVLIGTR